MKLEELGKKYNVDYRLYKTKKPVRRKAGNQS